MIEIFSPKTITDVARAGCPVCSHDRVRQGCRTRASRDGFTACHGNRQGDLRRSQGFTLVEMIAVVVLLSFGLIAGTQLFTMTAESYRDTSSRMKITQDGRFVIERLSRELRDALPNSVRVAGQCVEWVPVVAASRYLDLPQHTAALSFRVMEIDPNPAQIGGYFAAVFPVGSDAVYNSALPDYALRALSALPLNCGGDVANTDQICLAASATFSSPSPSDRIFIVLAPVSICVVDSDGDGVGSLFRYSGYGFNTAQSIPTGGVLLAENVLLIDSGAVTVFRYSAATLTRNAMLEMDIRLQENADVLRLQHTVFIRNSP